MHTSSAKQHSYFMRHFIRELKSSKGIIIARLILMAGFPLCMLISLTAFTKTDPDTGECPDTLIFLAGIAAATAAAGLLSGIAGPLKSFSYLHKKTKTDMMLALPANRNQMFFAGTLSGLAAYILPALPHMILTLAAAAAFKSHDGTISVCLPWSFSTVTVFGMTDLIILLAGFLILMLMIYCTALLSAVCCGKSFLAAFSAIVISGVAEAAVFALPARAVLKAAGTTMINSITAFTGYCAGPAGVFYYLNRFIERHDKVYYEYGYPELRELPEFHRWAAGSLLVSVLIMLTAFLLYRRRRAEDTAKPFAFSQFFYIPAAVFIVSVLSAASLIQRTLLAGIIGAVIFIYWDSVRMRTVKKLHISSAVYILSVALSIGFMKLSDYTHGFGTEYRVPSPDSVISVTASLPDPYTCSKNFGPNIYTDTEFKSREMIEAITNLHSDITDILRSSENSVIYSEGLLFTSAYVWQDFASYEGISPSDGSSVYELAFTGKTYFSDGKCLNESVSVRFSYLLKNGTRMNRDYSIPVGIIADHFASYAFTDEYKNQKISQFTDDMLSPPVRSVSSGDEVTTLSNQLYYMFDANGERFIRLSDDTAAVKISEAYKKDIESFSTEDLDGLYAKFCFNGFAVMSEFENTVKAITECTETAETHRVIGKHYGAAVYVTDTDFNPENIRLKKSDLHCGYGIYPQKYEVTGYSREALDKLLEKAVPEYYTSEKCYVINVTDTEFFIPAEYSSLCEDFMASGKCEEIVWKERAHNQYY